MAKKSGQPARTNQGTRTKPEMKREKLDATLANAAIIKRGLGFHDPAFARAPKPKDSEKSQK